MNTYTRKDLTLMLVSLLVVVPVVITLVLVGVSQFVAYQCDYPMGVSAVPVEFVLMALALTYAVGTMTAAVEVAEYRDARKAAAEKATRDARWTDWDEALYACEVMHATRNAGL